MNTKNMCRHCGSRGRHHPGCKRAVRNVVSSKRTTRRESDDDFLVICALRMAAYYTTRDDLRPHYIRLAEEREAIRKHENTGSTQ